MTRLRGEDDQWIEEEELIGQCFTKFYERLFQSSRSRRFEEVLNSVDMMVTEEDNRKLMQPVTEEEVKRATFDLGGNKAPGPDGYTGIFFQKSWDIIGKQVCSLVADYFINGFSLAEVNRTDLVLIPKKECPESINDYRPISLCNFIYKI